MVFGGNDVVPAQAGWRRELRQRAAELAWPDDLFRMGLDANLPEHVLRRLLRGTPESARPIIAAAYRVAGSGLRARELTFRDLDRFADLWRNSAEAIDGEDITVERSPDPLAQFRLQEDVSITILEDGAELVACMGWAAANVLLGGVPASVLYAQALRVRNDRRREGLAEVVRLFPKRATLRPTQGQVMFRRAGNIGVEKFLNAVGYRQDYERPVEDVVVHHLRPMEASELEQNIRLATYDDLPRCADLINRTHERLDLFRPVTAYWLEHQLSGHTWGDRPPESPLPYGRNDFFVLEADGAIQACAGMWNRGRDVRERVVSGPSGSERVYAYAALLDFGYAESGSAYLARLVEFLARNAAEVGCDALAVPLHHHIDVLAQLRGFAAREEARALEWTPFQAGAPRKLDKVQIDLRYW